MARRSKLLEQWQKKKRGSIPPEVRAALEGSTGRGVSQELVDRAFWLRDSNSDEWVTALEAVDKRRDQSALAALLRSERAMPTDVRVYLADLLERYQLVFWSNPELNEGWDAAVKALHKDQNCTKPSERRRPFLGLLGSGAHVPPEVRAILATVIERLKLTKKRGAPRTPAYDMTDIEQSLKMATQAVKGRPLGIDVDQSLKEVRNAHGFPEPGKDGADALRNAYRGQRHSSRRMKGRRP